MKLVDIEQWTNSVKVFPNPANDFLTIEANAQNIEITDVLGKKYLNLSNVRNSARVNTSSWPSGLYIINLDGQTEKVIIQ
jgi:hypothetical protein